MFFIILFRQKSRAFVAVFVETRFPSSTKNAESKFDVTRGGIRCPNAKSGVDFRQSAIVFRRDW